MFGIGINLRFVLSPRAEGLTVKELIEKEDVETPQYVTVTINDEFVESGAFETTEVKDGDEIEFLYFMGGGAR